jgi:hypothetical protein
LINYLARICERDKDAFIGNQNFGNKSDIVQSILGYQFFRRASLGNEPNVPVELLEEPTHAHHPRSWPTTVNPLTSSSSRTSFHRHMWPAMPLPWSPPNVGPPSHVPCMCLPLKPQLRALPTHPSCWLHRWVSSHCRGYHIQSVCGCLPRFWSRGLVLSTSELPMGRTQKKVDGAQCKIRMAWYAWERRLHALEVEELAYCFARDVHQSSSWSNYCGWSCGLWELVDLTFFFFGLPVSLNDINVLAEISSICKLASENSLAFNYIVNGHDYTMGSTTSILRGQHL